MRFLSLLPMLLPVVMGLTLHKADGTTIELGDEPMVIDPSEIIFPERYSVPDIRNMSDMTVMSDVATADYDHKAANVYLYEHINRQGRAASAYYCRDGMSSCMVFTAPETWASSIYLQQCPDGSANAGRGFSCTFFSTPTCDYTNPILWTSTSIPNLKDFGWNDKIKSVECVWNKLPN